MANCAGICRCCATWPPQLASHPAVTGFVIPTLRSLETRLRAEVANWPVPVTIVANRAERRGALPAEPAGAVGIGHGDAGTGAGRRAAWSLTYVMDTPQAREFDRLGRPPVGLPNIVLGRTVTEELITAQAGA